MRVTFFGVRGSLPTPGPSTVRYGGNTVCVEVRTADGTLIVLDAGTGMRELGNQLMRAPLPSTIHLLITHAHWDHIMGAPFFAPLWVKDTHIRVHPFSPHAAQQFGRMVMFDGEHFPVRAQDIPSRLEQAEVAEGKKRIGSALVSRIALNHPGGSDGFRIDDDDGSSLCYLTDNELSPPGAQVTDRKTLARFAAGTGLLIHDAQYLQSDLPAKSGWGHSVIDEVLELGREAEARVLALHHHDPERHDQALDRIAHSSTEWAAAHAPAMRPLVASEGLTLELD